MALLSTFGGTFGKNATEELSTTSRSRQKKWLFQQKKTSSSSIQLFFLLPTLVSCCLVCCPQILSVFLVRRVVGRSTTVYFSSLSLRCPLLFCWGLFALSFFSHLIRIRQISCRPLKKKNQDTQFIIESRFYLMRYYVTLPAPDLHDSVVYEYEYDLTKRLLT